MRRSILLAVGAVLAASGIFIAANAKADMEPQLENLKTQRASFLAKIPGLADLFDHDRNGINAAYNSFENKCQETIATLNKGIETENAKTGDAHDKAAVDALTAKLARLQAVRTDKNQVVWLAAKKKLDLLQYNRDGLALLANQLGNIDKDWAHADCDRAVLIGVFTELNKRTDDIKTQATAIITESVKQWTDAEHSLQE